MLHPDGVDEIENPQKSMHDMSYPCDDDPMTISADINASFNFISAIIIETNIIYL